MIKAKGHVRRLEQVFQTMRKKSKGQTCDAMKGLVEEGEDMIRNTEQSPLRDARLSGQRIEWRIMRSPPALSLLDATLTEENKADQKFTQLAETLVNEAAGRGAALSR